MSISGTGTEAGARVTSVDILRGLTILLMIFVNDLGHGAPSWMHHIKPPRADGMTLADIVFPFFLFIVGVSIPLALVRSHAAGLSTWSQLGHILARTAGLLLMGVIVLNSEEGAPALWSLLAAIAVILAWCVVPRESGWKRNVFIGLKVIGGAGLCVLLAIFRREPAPAEIPFWGTVDDWRWLRIGWWGILGLIGWAYLTVSLTVLVLGKRREWLMGSLAILILLHLAMKQGGLFARSDYNHKPWLGATLPVFETLSRWIDSAGGYVGLGDAIGSLAAITMAGCLLGTILGRDSDVTTPRARVSWAVTFTIGLLLAGLITDTFEGINKIGATPTWCLWCSALACGLWILLYLLADVAGWRAWSIVVRPAGANPLIAYFLHPIVIGLVSLSGAGNAVLGYKDSDDPTVVVGGSLVMAFFVCAVTGLLARLGLRVRL